jgi:hypothetical protein
MLIVTTGQNTYLMSWAEPEEVLRWAGDYHPVVAISGFYEYYENGRI